MDNRDAAVRKRGENMLKDERISMLTDRLPGNAKTVLSAIVFLVLYVALDWVGYFSPLYHLNVTPWNPAPALGLLYVIRRGRFAAVLFFVGIVASEIIVRDVPGNLGIILWIGSVMAFGYSMVAVLLKRYFPGGGLFSDREGLLRWSAIVIFGSLANSLLFVSILLLSGLLPLADWDDAVMRFWIGDSVGILVTMPLLWWLQDRSHRIQFYKSLLNWETMAYSVLTVAVLWIAFVAGAEAHFRYFYVLFLPLVWAASRQGLVGAVFCASMLQLGMLGAGLLQQSPEISLFELQMRAFLLALIGFLIGVAVDEQRRSATDLRNSMRLAAAGEMAGALAHELNQPLTALVAYCSACEQLIERGDDERQLRNVIKRMGGEAGRAADVMRRLRDFFRTGATRLEQIPLQELIETATASFHKLAATKGIEFSVGVIPIAFIRADRLQLEVVLRNILANAFEAVDEPAASQGRVTLAATIKEGNRIVIEVADNGSGLSAALAEQIFEPFMSTKSSGLGLGLAISRSITEAHGGNLTAEVDRHGCFHLMLPIEPWSR
jgi:signal transduction histidine kinase